MILGIVEIGLYGVRGKLSRTDCPTLWGISQTVKVQLCKSFIIGSIPISPSIDFKYKKVYTKNASNEVLVFATNKKGYLNW